MLNITLVATAHSENGKCNSDELYKIIEFIGPEVIFEEQTKKLFDMFYTGNQFHEEPPEVKCIKKYIHNHHIKHIPVDIDPSPYLSNSQIKYLFEIFNKYNTYKKLVDEEEFWTARDGFAYLNSEKCSEIFDKKRITEKELIQFELNMEQLSHIYKLFYEEQDNRENEMLQNIYKYSIANQFIQAVFLIGSAHRNSIIQKVAKYESKESIKLNWTFYSSQVSSEPTDKR